MCENIFSTKKSIKCPLFPIKTSYFTQLDFWFSHKVYMGLSIIWLGWTKNVENANYIFCMENSSWLRMFVNRKIKSGKPKIKKNALYDPFLCKQEMSLSFKLTHHIISWILNWQLATWGKKTGHVSPWLQETCSILFTHIPCLNWISSIITCQTGGELFWCGQV